MPQLRLETKLEETLLETQDLLRAFEAAPPLHPESLGAARRRRTQRHLLDLEKALLHFKARIPDLEVPRHWHR